MALTTYQSASLNSFAYNRNEYVLGSDISDFPKFKYLCNVLYKSTTITAIAPTVFNGIVMTKLTIVDNLYLTGDKIFIENNANYIIVDRNAGLNTITIDTPPDNLTITPGLSTCHRTISYQIDKDPSTELGVLNVGNTLKDFCTHKLVDSNNPYGSQEVLFRYALNFGEQYEYVFDFEDNLFSTGSTGFFNSSLPTSITASLPFSIGDQIVVQQNLYEWPYTDNVSAPGQLLAFTGSTANPFPIESQVYVTGQQTVPNYNGYQTVNSASTGSLLITDSTFVQSTPAESGSIFGTPAPSYNDVATITDIYWDVTYGLVVITDLPWAGSTPAISGTMKFADGRLIKAWDTIGNTRLVSTGKLDKLQEQSLNPEAWHVDNTVSGSKLFSSVITLQDSSYKQRIEAETKSWILVKPAIHTNGTVNTGSLNVTYKFYNDSNTLLGTGSYTNLKFNTWNSVAGYYGVYLPAGLNQLTASTTFTSSLAGYVNSVATYTMEATNGVATVSPIRFEINTDCGAGYDIYHILFKDSFGSWMSIPFKYKSFTSTETTSKTFYAKDGYLNATTNQMQYTAGDRGNTNIYKRYTDKFKLTSGWITDSENALIKDMLTSPVVYCQDTENNIRAVQLLNTELELAKSQNVSIFNYSIDIALSIDELRF